MNESESLQVFRRARFFPGSAGKQRVHFRLLCCTPRSGTSGALVWLRRTPSGQTCVSRDHMHDQCRDQTRRLPPSLFAVRQCIIFNPPSTSYHIMSSNRVFRIAKPEWLSSTLTRKAGVYLSGGIVYCLLTRRYQSSLISKVFDRAVHIHRRIGILPFPS